MASDDKDKIPQVHIDPEMQKQIDQDPELAAAIRDMSSQMRQAMQMVDEGKYPNFLDAMEGLTGQRPQQVGPHYKYGPILSWSDPNDKGEILAVFSDGSPQRGQEDARILDMDYFKSVEAAKEWFKDVQHKFMIGAYEDAPEDEDDSEEEDEEEEEEDK